MNPLKFSSKTEAEKDCIRLKYSKTTDTLQQQLNDVTNEYHSYK